MGLFKKSDKKNEAYKVIAPQTNVQRPSHPPPPEIRVTPQIHLQSIDLMWEYKPKITINNIVSLPDNNYLLFSQSRAKNKPNIIILDQEGNEKEKIEENTLKSGPIYIPKKHGAFFIGYQANHIQQSTEPKEDKWDSVLYYYNMKGKSPWKIEFPGEQISHILVLEEYRRILVGTRKNFIVGQGGLYCFDISGKNIWTYKGDFQKSIPMASQEVKFFPYDTIASEGGKIILARFLSILIALDLNGKELWMIDFKNLEKPPQEEIDVGGYKMSFSFRQQRALIDQFKITKNGKFIGVIYGKYVYILNTQGQIISIFSYEDYSLINIFLSETGRYMVILNGRQGSKQKLLFYSNGKLKNKIELRDVYEANIKILEQFNLIILGLPNKRLYIFNLQGEQIWKTVYEAGVTNITLTENGDKLGILADKFYLYSLKFGGGKGIIETEIVDSPLKIETGKVELVWNLKEDLLEKGSIFDFSITDQGEIVLIYSGVIWFLSSDGKVYWKHTPKKIIPGYGKRINKGDDRYTIKHSSFDKIAISEDGKAIWVSIRDNLIWEPSRLIRLDRKGNIVWITQTETVASSLKPLPNYGLLYETYSGECVNYDSDYKEVSKFKLEGKSIQLNDEGKTISINTIKKEADEVRMLNGNILYSDKRNLNARNKEGQELWSLTATAKINGIDVYDKKDLILFRAGINIFLLDTKGILKWKKRVGKMAVYSQFNKDQDGIVTLSMENGVAVYDLDGNQQKNVPIKTGRELSVIDFKNGMILAQSGDMYDRFIYLIEETGKIVWNIKTEGYIRGAIALNGYFIIMTNKIFEVYHYRKEEG